MIVEPEQPELGHPSVSRLHAEHQARAVRGQVERGVPPLGEPNGSRASLSVHPYEAGHGLRPPRCVDEGAVVSKRELSYAKRPGAQFVEQRDGAGRRARTGDIEA